MRVAACQVPDVREDVPRALAIIETMARNALEAGADAAVFPECFLQGYFTDVASVQRLAINLHDEVFSAVLTLSKEFPLVLVIGMIERTAHGCYNSAVVLERGEMIGCYRKTALLESERRSFESGGEFPIFEIADRRVGINICYDLCFSDLAQGLVAQGAEVLLCPCNNMLARANAEDWKEKHNAIRADRCRETGLWLVSSDVTGERDDRVSYGPTAVINPKGTVLDQVPLLTEGMLVVDI